MFFDFINLLQKDYSGLSIGASTSICAIMGLFIANVIALYYKGADIRNAKRSIIFMLISLTVVSLLPGVDIFGHFGSLFSGILLGMMLIPQDDLELGKMKKIGIVGFIIYSLMLLSIWFIWLNKIDLTNWSNQPY